MTNIIVFEGHDEVIKYLNIILVNELSAINQYFLHARMLQNWGFSEAGEKEYKASIDEMKHADALIKRILLLEGIPNVQKLNKIQIGQNLKEIIKSDLDFEKLAIPALKEAIQKCEELSDYVSRDLFVDILKSEEEHVDWLETQQNLIKEVGIQNYQQSSM